MSKELTIKRTAKDYYGEQYIEIKIENESVELPMKIISDFIKNEKVEEVFTTIPD